MVSLTGTNEKQDRDYVEERTATIIAALLLPVVSGVKPQSMEPAHQRVRLARSEECATVGVGADIRERDVVVIFHAVEFDAKIGRRMPADEIEYM